MARGGTELNASQSRQAAAKIREELARRRMSRQTLADAAKIGISTLEKALGGARPFTLATLVRIEQVLGVPLREPAEQTAAAEWGGYARAGLKWLEGGYLALRPSFECPGAVFAYRMDFSWDEAGARLVFGEGERLDAQYTQKGVVSAPLASGHIYLYTNEIGQMRLGILSRPLRTGEMYGLLTTLKADRGPALVPISVPLALVPLKAGMAFGQIAKGDARFDAYRAHLVRAVADGFARFEE